MNKTVQADLTYVTDSTGDLAIYNYRPGPDDPDLSGRYQQPTYRNFSAEIFDIRDSEADYSLDEQGLAVASMHSQITDYYDENQVREIYMPEIEALVKLVTSADRVHAFDFNVRCQTFSEQKKHMARKPVRFAHNDYTDASGPQRVRDILGDEAEGLLKKRFAVINVWKPIVGPVQRTPLAVCDARSMQPDDFIDTSLLYRDRTGQIQMVAHRAKHRWCYLSNMRADEALLLKCYDSAKDGRARATAHTAFDDPTTPQDAPDRQSIEVRTLAFFD